MSVPLFCKTKVATPATEVQTPLIERSTGGGGGGVTHVVISTTVVNELSFAEENVYKLDVPVTVIVVLWLALRSIEPEAATAPFASMMTYVYGVVISVVPVLVITKVASPALDVHTPLIERSAGGGGGTTQVDISTIVVNEASSGEVKVYEVDEPVTVIVVL